MTFRYTFLLLLSSLLTIPAQANSPEEVPSVFLDREEWNPFSPDAEELLKKFDKVYEEETGLSPWLEEDPLASRCYRASCAVWAEVIKSQQMLHLYFNGARVASWPVSTGVSGYTTPNFDRHPNGRIYDRYSSKSFPGGDWRGLGNMPYAVFIAGGFAIHGTPEANWPLLGRPASHGCIRVHPSHGHRFNRAVRQVGVKNVWITVR